MISPHTKFFSKSVWITPAACGAFVPYSSASQLENHRGGGTRMPSTEEEKSGGGGVNGERDGWYLADCPGADFIWTACEIIL